MKNVFKKISVLGIAMLVLTAGSQAQWTRNAATLQTYLTNTGDNVGIGTTNPQFKLDIQNNGPASMSFKSSNDNSNLIIDRGNSSSTAGVNYRTAGTPYWQTGNIGTDNFAIRNVSLGAPAISCNFATNNVGIGTTAPGSRLDVRDAVSVTNGGHAVAVFGDVNGTGGGIANGWYANGTAVTGGWMRSLNNFPLFIGTKGTTQALTILDNGNTGVGTTAPARKLHVFTGASGVTPMTNAGIVLEGSSQIFLNLLVPNGFETGVGFGNPGSNTDAGIYYNGIGANKLDLRTGGNVSRMTIDGTGNVGIGVTAPAHKLDVCGTIRAKEVRIETGWCDYVFADDYKLRTIEDVEAFINDHKHLPGIAPASEVEAEGMKVGEMSKAMMEKIEELTLYLIDQHNQIKELKKQNQLQQQQLDSLKK